MTEGSGSALTKWTTVPAMLERLPETWASFAAAEHGWLSDELSVEAGGPFLLLGLLEDVLYSKVLLPAYRRDRDDTGLAVLLRRVGHLCNEMLASRRSETGGVPEAVRNGGSHGASGQTDESN